MSPLDNPRAQESSGSWEISRRELLLHPPERVWAAWTNASELSTWFAERTDVDLDARRFAFFGSGVYGTRGANDDEVRSRAGNFEILELDVGQSIEFRWWIHDVPTIVRVDFENHLQQTMLEVRQRADRNPGWSTTPSAPTWWWILFASLRSYLADGRPDLVLDYERLASASKLRFTTPVSTFPWIIWDRLATPNQLDRWWGSGSTLDTSVGAAFGLGFGDNEWGPRQVLGCEAPARLKHDWIWPGGARSEVEWTIEETDDDTLLSVELALPDALGSNEAERALAKEHAGVYWASALLCLQHLSEKGISPREHEAP